MSACHDSATYTPYGLMCDCGEEFHHLQGWRAHTVEAFNSPSPDAIGARTDHGWSLRVIGVAAESVTPYPCTKVGCHAKGNGRECWRVDTSAGTLFELPSRDAAVTLMERGGVVSESYAHSFC